jgi:hypothetical protein
MSSFAKDIKSKDKKLSIGSIQSYKPLSKNASRLLDHMIEYAIERHKAGETTHIMTFDEVVGTFGLSSTSHRDYIKAKIKEVQDLDGIKWDFLGEERKFIDSVKEISRGDIDRLIQRTSFKSIVETEHFESINIERIMLKNNKQERTKAYLKLVDEMLDLLFPLYIGNTKMFESLDIHKSKVSFSLNRHLVDIFMNPNVYGILDRSINFMFVSPYSMRLYQNACIYRHLGVTPWFSIDQAKMIFCIEKIKDDEGEFQFKHKVYSQFKRNVIGYAIKECNKFSKELRIPFSIDLEEDISITPGKSVDRVRFHIKPNQEINLDSIESDPVLGVKSMLDESDLTITTSELTNVVNEMSNLKVKKPAAIEDVEYACTQHGATYVGLMKNIEYCKSQIEKRRKIGGEPIKPGYIRKAIRDGYIPYESDELEDIESIGKKQKAIKSEGDSSRKDPEKLYFLEQLLLFSQVVLEGKNEKYSSLIENLSKRDPLLRTMVAMDTVTKEVIAERLLTIPDESFRKITGMVKEFQKPELNDFFN